MKRQCQVCGQKNGSCNRYILKNGQEITICPNCIIMQHMVESNKQAAEKTKEYDHE